MKKLLISGIFIFGTSLLGAKTGDIGQYLKDLSNTSKSDNFYSNMQDIMNMTPDELGNAISSVQSELETCNTQLNEININNINAEFQNIKKKNLNSIASLEEENEEERKNLKKLNNIKTYLINKGATEETVPFERHLTDQENEKLQDLKKAIFSLNIIEVIESLKNNPPFYYLAPPNLSYVSILDFVSEIRTSIELSIANNEKKIVEEKIAVDEKKNQSFSSEKRDNLLKHLKKAQESKCDALSSSLEFLKSL